LCERKDCAVNEKLTFHLVPGIFDLGRVGHFAVGQSAGLAAAQPAGKLEPRAIVADLQRPSCCLDGHLIWFAFGQEAEKII